MNVLEGLKELTNIVLFTISFSLAVLCVNFITPYRHTVLLQRVHFRERPCNHEDRAKNSLTEGFNEAFATIILLLSIVTTVAPHSVNRK